VPVGWHLSPGAGQGEIYGKALSAQHLESLQRLRGAVNYGIALSMKQQEAGHCVAGPLSDRTACRHVGSLVPKMLILLRLFCGLSPLSGASRTQKRLRAGRSALIVSVAQALSTRGRRPERPGNLRKKGTWQGRAALQDWLSAASCWHAKGGGGDEV